MTQENDKKDLIIAALKQRIGTLVSNYETDIAMIRAEYTELQKTLEVVSSELEGMRIANDPKKIYREGEDV